MLAKVRARDPHQDEFLQAVEEVLLSLKPVLAKNPEYVPMPGPTSVPVHIISIKHCVCAHPMHASRLSRSTCTNSAGAVPPRRYCKVLERLCEPERVLMFRCVCARTAAVHACCRCHPSMPDM